MTTSKEIATLEEVDLRRHLVVEASAGSGKTYTLEHLFVQRLLNTSTELDQILVVTFSEKAARELKHRLKQRLQHLATDPTTTNRPGVSDQLANALANFHTGNILTIHALCQRFLQKDAFSRGRFLESKLEDSRVLFREAFMLTLRTIFATREPYTAFLSNWLREARLVRLENLLFECYERQGELYSTHQDPSEVIAEVLASLPSPGQIRPVIQRSRLTAQQAQRILFELQSLHRLLETHAGEGVPSLSAFDESWRTRMRTLQSDLGRLAEASPRLSIFREALTKLIDEIQPLESRMAGLFLPAILENLRRIKQETGRYDFQDMLSLLAESLRTPGSAALEFGRLFRCVLVDEFQDTDVVQWEIIRTLFLHPESETTLVTIGDPKQAIYGFRGADLSTYFSAQDELYKREGQRLVLGTNYRSTPALIRILNTIFGDTDGASFFSGRVRFEPAQPHERSIDPSVSTEPPVTVFSLSIEEDQAPVLLWTSLRIAIAETIRSILAKESSGQNQVFVLTRTVREATEMGDTLRSQGIPVSTQERSTGQLEDALRDIRELLEALDEPSSEARRFRAFLGPFLSLAAADLFHLRSLPGTHPVLRRFGQWVELAERRQYHRLFDSMMHESGVRERAGFFEGHDRTVLRYDALLKWLLSRVERRSPPLREWLPQMHDVPEPRELGAYGSLDGDLGTIVQVMTMHRAKGLEADHVFLYGGFREGSGQVHAYHEDGRRRLFVGDTKNRPAIEREAREEEERLYYVGLTRAKEKLYLPLAPKHLVKGPYKIVNRVLAAMVTQEDPPHELRIEKVLARTPRDPRELKDVLVRWEERTSLALMPRSTAFGFESDPSISPYSPKRPQIVSYSSLKAEQAPVFISEAEREIRPVVEAGDLPPGPATGRFLHELLENLDFGQCRALGFEAWQAQPNVQIALQRAAARHLHQVRAPEGALEVLFRAATSPILSEALHLPDGVAGLGEVVREMEFLMRSPEPDHYIKGYMDVVFPWEERVYVLDWKSDWLPSYDKPYLQSRVHESYDLQAKIYLAALSRSLHVTNEAAYHERVGGFLFCFLRGMDPTGGGTVFLKPSWEEIRTYHDQC
jgi:exodeoxyribonuclease V beta subunit